MEWENSKKEKENTPMMVKSYLKRIKKEKKENGKKVWGHEEEEGSERVKF